MRTQFLQELTVEEMKWAFGEEGRRGNEESKGIYRLCYLLAIKCGGFEKRAADGDRNFPIGHLDEVLFHGKVNREMMLERMQGELLGDLAGPGAEGKPQQLQDWCQNRF